MGLATKTIAWSRIRFKTSETFLEISTFVANFHLYCFFFLFFFVCFFVCLFFPKVQVQDSEYFSLRVKMLADMHFNRLNVMDRLWYDINTVTPFFLKKKVL